MKIALVVPQPVPYVVGGAQNLWAGLIAAFSVWPDLTIDLIEYPSLESQAKEILDSYQHFSHLDLSHYDAVISTKYPAWCVKHPRHVVYLQHTLRGLYDTYPPHLNIWESGLEVLIDCLALPKVYRRLLIAGHADDGLDQVDLSDFIQSLQDLYQQDPLAAAPWGHLWDFPGPFMRRVVQAMDAVALQPQRIHCYAAISTTVAQREDYFPPQVAVAVIHHPSHLVHQPAAQASMAHTLPPAYVFTASRLEHPKRIDLMMQAYAKSGISEDLVIAGVGPEMQALQTLANQLLPGRIHLLGRVSDADLDALYQGATGVVFLPQDEDWGLIAVEALQRGQAVLTTTDAGGPTEMIVSGQNGWVVEPSLEGLVAGFHDLVHLRKDAELAQRAIQSQRHITWTHLTQSLMHLMAGESTPVNKTSQVAPAFIGRAKPKVMVINTFAIEPLTSGGRLRMWGLYRHMANYCEVHCVNLGGLHAPAASGELAPDLVETIVPVTAAYERVQREHAAVLGVSAGDYVAAIYPELLEPWSDAMHRVGRQAHYVIAAHPYAHPAWQRLNIVKPLIYEAHNVEFDLKLPMYGVHTWASDHIRSIEHACVNEAIGVVACSDTDLQRLKTLYAPMSEQCLVLPNGIELSDVPVLNQHAREALRQNMQVRRPLMIFMGSDHEPNRQAVCVIVEAARLRPHIDFVIIGSVAHRMQGLVNIPNVLFTGVISEAQKQVYLHMAHAGLNPILEGSGTNLKLAEYAAWEIPILSTRLGARGGIFEVHRDYEEISVEKAPSEALCQALDAYLVMDPTVLKNRVKHARAQVAHALDWGRLAHTYADWLLHLS